MIHHTGGGYSICSRRSSQIGRGTRAVWQSKFQPHFEGGLPFDHDQWISATANAWAAMVLSLSAEPTVITRNKSGN
jgi:hypothetical protein